MVDESRGGALLEEVEESKAFFQVYDGAVYLHQVRLDVWCGKASNSYGEESKAFFQVYDGAVHLHQVRGML